MNTQKQGHQGSPGGERRERESGQHRQETGQTVHTSPQHKGEHGTGEHGTEKSGQQSGQHAPSREK